MTSLPPEDPAPLRPEDGMIEETAIAWLAEREEGFTPARERDFTAWLRADSRHGRAISRLDQTLTLLESLPEFRGELNREFHRAAPVVPFPTPASARRRGWHRIVAVSLAAAAVAAGLLVVTRWNPSEDRYSTTSAGYARARLDDGSTLELNAASAVRVRFTPDERRINLEAGEAHFEVAHDTMRPFVVRAGDVVVRAVGTAFNVRFQPDGGVEVMVTEGTVEVSHSGVGTSIPHKAPLVTARERLVVPRNGPLASVDTLPPEALRASLAWQSRLADFADAQLSEVIARFNLRSRVQLRLVDAEVGQHRIGGTFALDEAEAFVRLLERDGEIVGVRSGQNEILLRRAR